MRHPRGKCPNGLSRGSGQWCLSGDDGGGGNGAELSLQKVDIEPHGIISGIRLVGPDVLEQIGGGQFLSLVLYEQLHELEFLHGEAHGVLRGELQTFGIQREIAAVQLLCVIFPAAAHERADPREQFLHGKRFGEIVIRAVVESLHAVIHLRFGCQEQHGRRDVLRPHFPQYLEAGFLWHHDIENDAVVSVPPDERERLFAVIGGVHIVILHGQDCHQCVVEVLCIFCKQ